MTKKSTGRGRPSKYDEIVKPHLEEIKKAVSQGATNEEIAKGLGIAVSALCRYKNDHEELRDAFALGKAEIIFDIKASLLKKALGFYYTEEKKLIRKGKDESTAQSVEQYKRYCPPSETAAGMLLRNYDPSWSDHDKATVDLREQEAELKKQMAEMNFPAFELEEIK